VYSVELPRRDPPRHPLARVALIEAAPAASRCTGSYFNAHYHRIARRRGTNKATVAVAHSLLTVLWLLMANPEMRYEDLGPDYSNDVRTQTYRSSATSPRSASSATPPSRTGSLTTSNPTSGLRPDPGPRAPHRSTQPPHFIPASLARGLD
jgi:hypothetical protein